TTVYCELNTRSETMQSTQDNRHSRFFATRPARRRQSMSTRLKIPVECVVDARNTTGESPLWSEREAALYWVDIPDGWIYRWQPTTGERRTWKLPAAVGSI